MSRETPSNLFENLRIDCPEVYSGIVMEKLSKRKGQMVDITYEGDSWVDDSFRDTFTGPHRLS